MIRRSIHIATLLLSIFLYGCSSKIESANDNMVILPGGVNQGGVFRTNLVSDVSSFDPVRIVKASEILVSDQVFNKLIVLNDSNISIDQDIAHRWTVSEDGKTYTFHLRTDVFFQDDGCFEDGKGRKVTAEDVRYSLTRILDAREKSLGAEFFADYVQGGNKFYSATLKASQEKNTPSVATVSGYIVENDSTFTIQLKEQSAPFIYHLATPFAYIVPKEAIEKYGDSYARKPIGTGPFLFKQWNEDREIILERNPTYWEKDQYGNALPYLNQIRYSFIKEASSQFLAFQKGTLDENVGIPREFTSQVFLPNGEVTRAYKEKYKVLQCTELRIDYLAMRYPDSLFKNKDLRTAIAMAIDKEKIARYVLKGLVLPSKGVVPRGFKGYDNRTLEVHAYNPTKAKMLLKKAGYENGDGFPEIVLNIFIGPNYAYNKDVAEAIQSMLAEIGIKASIEQTEYSTHLQLAYLGKLQFFLGSWGADYPDPETFLSLLNGKTIPKNPDGESYLNLSRYKNDLFDATLEKAITIKNQAKRYKYYQQAEQIALDDTPIVVMYDRLLTRLQNKKIKNYPINPMDRRMYKRIWFSN